MKTNIYAMQRPLTVLLSSTGEIKYVCQGEPPKEMQNLGDVVIKGEWADLLYLSVAGHAFEEHPDAADESRAIGARWKLCNISGARDVHLALIRFGHRIKPWLGCTPLDGAGHPLMDAAEHNLEIPLEIPKNAPISMRMIVV